MATSGIRSRTSVSSSEMAKRKPPSPAPKTGSRSGRSLAAPMDVYKPRPIDWKAWVKQNPNSSETDR